MNKKVLAYGTLREGDYNFERIQLAFGTDSIKKVGQTKVQNFKMHSLGPYPAIVQSEGEEIVCDLLEVNEKAFNFIEAMEKGAGYDSVEVDVDGNKHTIYTHTSDLSRYPVIKTGDWFNKD